MNAENLAEQWIVFIGFRFVSVQHNRFFNLLSHASFFFAVFEALAILWELQQHLPIIIHEFRMPELKEQRASPDILPVDEASNSIAFHKEICGMNIPMPKGRAGKLLALGEKVRYGIQEPFVE